MAEDAFWEGLIPWLEPEEESDVLRDSSALPRLTFTSATALMEHCCRAISALRGVVSDAEWDVALGHLPIAWDDVSGCYVIGPEHLEHYQRSLAWEAGLT